MNAPCSPLEFYELVQLEISSRELEGVGSSFITRRENGLFSPQRTYLRIRQGKLYFDICAFLIGNSFISSYWLHRNAPDAIDLLAELPVLNFLLKHTVLANTYYTVDYVEHFQRSIHESILNVIDGLSEDDDLVFLSEKAPEPNREGVVWKDAE